jgi:hypothetical protein
MKIVVVATLLTASLVGVAAPAHADDQAPTVDQVVALMAELTDPGRPAASKNDIVTPGFSPDEAGTIDDQLNRMNARGRILPLPFIVTDIESAPNNCAGATIATGGSPRQSTSGKPVLLVNQGGRRLTTHDSAIAEINVLFHEATRYRGYVP